MGTTELIEKGKQMLEAGKADEARSYFQELLGQPDQSAQAHLWLGRMDMMAFDPESGLRHVDEALRQDPTSAEGMAVKAIYHIIREDHSQALQLLETARAMDPLLAMIYPNLSICYRQLKRIPEALSAAQKGVEMAPKDSAAHFALAQSLGAAGRLQESVDEAIATLNLNPMHLMAYVYLGTIYQQTGHVEELVKLYNEGLRVNPLAIALREKLVEIYMKRRNYVAALEHVQILANQARMMTPQPSVQ